MRRLPVYLLLDTSGSMRGEPLEAVKVGLQAMVSTLRQDPFALESVYLSIITFDRQANPIMPLTDIQAFQVPAIVTPDSGPTHLGQALELLCQRVDAEIITSTSESKGDWKPLLFIMTDGSPSDLMKYRQMIPEVKKRNFASIIGCAAGPKAQQSHLEELVTNMVSLDTMDGKAFQQLFVYFSKSISAGSRSMGTSTPVVLPPPPAEVIVQ